MKPRLCSWRNQLKKIEVGLFVHNIEEFKGKIKELEENMDIFETQKVKEEEKSNHIQTEKEVLKENIDKLIEEIEKIQNTGFEVSNKAAGRNAADEGFLRDYHQADNTEHQNEKHRTNRTQKPAG